MVALTTRMRNWLEGTGVHVGTATPDGLPTVVVVDRVRILDDEHVELALSGPQIDQIRENIALNPQVALAPGGLGSIRAAYQFKGEGRLEGQRLTVRIDEIYSTKPGPEAGLRLDTLGHESMVRFEETRWRDAGPPARVNREVA